MMGMTSMTSSLTKLCLYERMHDNAKTVFINQLQTTDEYDVFKITVYENICVYDRPNEDAKTPS